MPGPRDNAPIMLGDTFGALAADRQAADRLDDRCRHLFRDYRFYREMPPVGPDAIVYAAAHFDAAAFIGPDPMQAGLALADYNNLVNRTFAPGTADHPVHLYTVVRFAAYSCCAGTADGRSFPLSRPGVITAIAQSPLLCLETLAFEFLRHEFHLTVRLAASTEDLPP